MPQTSNRTKDFGESIIRKMSRISNQYGSINLSQGFPDFDPPQELQDALSSAATQGPHQYAITWGAKNFRDALAQKIERSTGLEVDPEKNLVVTCGSTEAMMASMLSVVNPGDKVVVFSPFYENYGADAILSGAEPIYVPLTPPSFSFDRAELRSAFEQSPKALILCNPSNPTGKVFTLDELNYIASLAEEFDVWIITDEVYEHIIYEPYKHISFASLPNMAERTITCNSLSKTYSITGWRLGYVFGDKKVIDSVKKVHDFLTVGAAAPLQEAAVVGLKMPDSYYKELQNVYTKKRDVFTSYLDKIDLKYTKPQGAYYVLVDISEFNADDDNRFCEWLCKEVGVAAVPGSSFFREPINHLIRFHYAKQEETLHAAGERLLKLREIWRERGY
ncbi:MAG: aminotransferase class I/II-fold pyridoxal phosphate-dependent enzyme [Sphaerochaetaceae bacterium]|nr:aminotransferase class I/II-fold pyridoxal phosphate-dependent enzyme [Sphaerochaetaceae bacterium]